MEGDKSQMGKSGKESAKMPFSQQLKDLIRSRLVEIEVGMVSSKVHPCLDEQHKRYMKALAHAGHDWIETAEKEFLALPRPGESGEALAREQGVLMRAVLCKICTLNELEERLDETNRFGAETTITSALQHYVAWKEFVEKLEIQFLEGKTREELQDLVDGFRKKDVDETSFIEMYTHRLAENVLQKKDESD